jgi:hypothetical protein
VIGYRPGDIAEGAVTVVCRTISGAVVHRPGTRRGRTHCGRWRHGPYEHVVLETVEWCHTCYGKGHPVKVEQEPS